MCIGYNSPSGQGIAGLFQSSATKKTLGYKNTPVPNQNTASLMALQGLVMPPATSPPIAG